MTFTTRITIAVMIAASFGLLACSDDDGGTRDATVTPDATVDSSTDATADATGDTGGGDADASGGGACTNMADMTAIGRMDYGAMMDQSYAAVATACAVSSLGMDPYEPAVNMCLNTMTMSSASMACSSCYSASAACAATNCALVCAANPAAMECTECRCGMNAAMQDCDAEFTACSGIPTTTCDGL